MGMSKKVSASMPPEPIRLVQAERMRVVLMKGEDMVMSDVSVCNVSFYVSDDVRWNIVCRDTRGIVRIRMLLYIYIWLIRHFVMKECRLDRALWCLCVAFAMRGIRGARVVRLPGPFSFRWPYGLGCMC